jgi:uncharacterized protein (TIGR00297 family)
MPLIAALTAETFTTYIVRHWSWQPQWQPHYLEVSAISILFGALAFWLRAATPAAAASGAMICFLLTWHTGWVIRSPLYSALTPLLALFVLTFLSTHAGRKKKLEQGIAESHRGRNAAQVIANLGIAALLTSLWLRNNVLPFLSFDNVFDAVVLAALAEATADTVSSEIGQAFGGTPFMLTTLRRVPPGTDGAISLKGTLAGIAAAGIVVALGAPTMGLTVAQCVVAFAAATCGLFFDTLLGATIERKGWLGNDLVNFTSTAFAAAVALIVFTFGPLPLITN